MFECGSTRERKRRATALRISRCAQRLTEQHGLDGFTMDDLAAAAGVSRRTLFNYFGGKTEAVLGPAPQFTEASRATFLAGGPTGNLADDCAVLAHDVLGADPELEREDLARAHRLFLTNPRLLVTLHERFEEITGELGELVAQRKGVDVTPTQTRLLVRLFATVLEASLTAYLADDSESFPDLFDQNLQAARDLLA